MKTLPAKYYTDSVVLQAEIERFFHGMWLCVGNVENIPSAGAYFVFNWLKESFLVVKGQDSTIRAFYNVCRHRGTRLCEDERGAFQNRIQCPYHAWGYGLDGRLVSAPHMVDTPGFNLEHFPLKQVACDQWGGRVFIHIEPSPRPLAEQLGPLIERFKAWNLEELRIGHSKSYTIRANWKLIIQNYSECLHCPFIHPALQKLSHYLSGDNEPARSNYLGGTMSLHDSVDTLTWGGKSQRAPLPGLDDEQKRLVYYYWVSPNLLLTLASDYVMTHRLYPLSPDTTSLICEWFFHPSELAKPDFDASDAVQLWELTNSEDWRVCELSQQGLSSKGYEPGPYSSREQLLHEFDKIIAGEGLEPPTKGL